MKLKKLSTILAVLFFSISNSVLADSSAQSIWYNLVGEKFASRAAFSYVENNPQLPNVLIYGDSISIAYTESVRANMKGKANIYRLYRNGQDSSRLIKNMQYMHKAMTDSTLDEPWSFNWDIIHFNVGLHDLKYVANGQLDKHNGQLTTSIEEYKLNIKHIVEYLQSLSPNATLIFATTTPVPDGAIGRFAGDGLTYNKAAIEVISKYKDIKINDLYSLTKPSQSTWWLKQGDVHYNQLGIEAQAQQVSSIIKEVLKN